jgi:uncharacterized protein
MNIKNAPTPGDFFVIPHSNHSCDHFKDGEDFDQIEFDPNKDVKNQDKHGISLSKAREILADPFKLQVVSDSAKWEDFSKINFEKLNIPKNTGNLDPIRGLVFGHIDNKLYVFAYTFRHEIGDTKYRVISLRRASEEEREMYNSLRNGMES